MSTYTVQEEDVIYAITNYLDANLDTYLSGIETLKNDGITLTDIKKYYVGSKDILSENSFPVAYAIPAPYEFDNDYTTTADLLRPVIMLTIAIAGGVTRNLDIKALRYAAAVRQAINADRTAGGTVCRSRVINYNWFVLPEMTFDHILIEIAIEAEIEVQR